MGLAAVIAATIAVMGGILVVFRILFRRKWLVALIVLSRDRGRRRSVTSPGNSLQSIS